jgi:hypothetical protein
MSCLRQGWGLIAILGVQLSGCAFSVSKPCTEGGDPAREKPVRGTKQCYQQKDASGHYVNNGKYLEWHPNGLRATEGEYKLGRKDGKWSEWDDTGRLVSERWFDNGVEGMLPSRGLATPASSGLRR